MSRPPTDTEERLFDCALTLFAIKGYAATSVREIIETVGLSKPVLYYYCDSKLDLFCKLIERVHERANKGLEDLVAGNRSPVEKLRLIIHGTFEFCRSDWRIPRLMFSAKYGPLVPEIANFINKIGDWRYGLIREIILKGIAKRELKKTDPDVLTLTFCSCMDHVANVFTAEEASVARLTPELADSLFAVFLTGARSWKVSPESLK